MPNATCGTRYIRRAVKVAVQVWESLRSDMLAALGLRYGTEEATEFSEKVHKTVASVPIVLRLKWQKNAVLYEIIQQ